MNTLTALRPGPLLARILLAATLALSGLTTSAPAAAQTATAPQALASGTAVGGISGAYGSQRYYTIEVPAGASALAISIAGTSGDADLYVRRGALPTLSSWDYRPYRSGSNESVSVSAPASGTWYLMLRGYQAYSGLTLKATVTGGGTVTPIAAAPSFSPAPGTHSGRVSVSLAPATPDAVVRYTLDGSTPSSGSEVYTAPILITSTTQVRAATFASGQITSAIASGTYTIINPVQTLATDTTLAGLAGAQGSVANFRVAVPAGVSSVSFSIAGGSGDADLYVKYGQLATTSTWDQRPYLSGNAETVTIATPRAGDYFLMVHGYRAYSGVTLKVASAGTASVGKPDITIAMDAANPRITTETFAANACEIEEGTITAGTHRLLRFNTQTRNIGTADLVLGNPASSSSFEWGACHGHYHFRSFAQYRLLDTSGAVVRTGKKVGFCLMDITRIDGGANPSARYTCSNQGIQAGWADVYSSNLSGQWIDITGVPAGSYVLEIVMDPMNLIDELDESNNTGRLNVTIP
ncbi:pre-peptidase C-terminal domain-containing protein [Sphaerotilus uruguayifluvii]|uniref:Peptidase C-terminal archaeal/bacterial domain-containing protein n=1 Tax=Sphaerotilus uruguayifluvii TaxID=2735897 RepID=A0ABX2G9E8_9BURK|nr:pre-peptidase C-terminal domain-containing protein [Leptothrix sp. C29]NRT57907.1 hypothetical protein [Leptothrix sp. C29]